MNLVTINMCYADVPCSDWHKAEMSSEELWDPKLIETIRNIVTCVMHLSAFGNGDLRKGGTRRQPSFGGPFQPLIEFPAIYNQTQLTIFLRTKNMPT